LCQEIVGAGNLLIQKQLSVHFETVEPVAAPWDKHIFIVGANHKAGTFLLRKIMRHWFDLLGATSSCTMERSWPRSITTLNHIHNCDLYPAPIRYTWNISGDMILQMRKETNDMKGDLRGVIIVRDPLEMVASAYVYHHRGEEPWNEPMEQGIPLMAPEDGRVDTKAPAAPGHRINIYIYMYTVYIYNIYIYESMKYSDIHRVQRQKTS